MNKDQFQKELKEKLKLGIKPSDLKKPQAKNSQIPTPPLSPIIEPLDKKARQKPSKEGIKDKDQIKQLQDQVNFHANTANTYLTNLQATMAQLDQAELEKEDLKREIQTLNKTVTNLQNQTKSPESIKETKDQSTQAETKKTFILKNYSCQICFENRKGGIPSQLLRVKGLGGERNKKIWVCFLCRKQVVIIYDEEENWRNF